MVEQARAYLEPDFGERIEVIRRDLLALNLDGVADVVFSTATFHWIPDQDGLFRNLARALKPGGRLLAQMGGKGNLQRTLRQVGAIERAPEFRAYFEGWDRPNVYPDKDETRQRLQAAGFHEIELELFPEPTSFSDATSFANFVRAVILRLNLQRLPDQSLRETFIDRLIDAASRDDPPYTLDYWRLNLSGFST